MLTTIVHSVSLPNKFTVKKRIIVNLGETHLTCFLFVFVVSKFKNCVFTLISVLLSKKLEANLELVNLPIKS